jgi:hypothetical protein
MYSTMPRSLSTVKTPNVSSPGSAGITSKPTDFRKRGGLLAGMAPFSVLPAIDSEQKRNKRVKCPLDGVGIWSFLKGMPEPYWPKRKNAYKLSHARQHFEIARIWCSYCKTQRHFWIDDLKQLFGDIECDDVVYQPGWRCEKCGQGSVLEMEVVKPSAEDRQRMTVRRIESIVYVRKVTWRDEKA